MISSILISVLPITTCHYNIQRFVTSRNEIIKQFNPVQIITVSLCNTRFSTILLYLPCLTSWLWVSPPKCWKTSSSESVPHSNTISMKPTFIKSQKRHHTILYKSLTSWTSSFQHSVHIDITSTSTASELGVWFAFETEGRIVWMDYHIYRSFLYHIQSAK
jgi:hypothetical protein